MSYGQSSGPSSGGGGYGKSSGGGSYNPVSAPDNNQPTGSAPATGGSYGKSSPGTGGSYGAAPDSLAASSIGGPAGANFFTGVANNAPGGAYGATQQATDQLMSAGQPIGYSPPVSGAAGRAAMGDTVAQNAVGLANLGNQLGMSIGVPGSQYGPGGQAIGAAMSPQNLYNQYASTLFGQPSANSVENTIAAQRMGAGQALSAAGSTAIPQLSPEQNQSIAAQTALFQNQPSPQDAYNSYSNVLFGRPELSYTSYPDSTQIPTLSDEQNKMIAAQTAMFNSQIEPSPALRGPKVGYGEDFNLPLEQQSSADQINQYPQPAITPFQPPAPTPAPFAGVSTAPATVRPQPAVAPRTVAAPRPAPRPVAVKPVAKPPVTPKPAPFKPVLTRPGVQPVLRTAPRPPSR